MTNREQIIAKALEALDAKPHGIRYSELVRSVHEALPDIPINTVHGSLWNVEVKLPSQVFKPARGLYIHTKYREGEQPEQPEVVSPAKEKITEKAFYGPFAGWLING